jgi:two-component system response regulator MtrA
VVSCKELVEAAQGYQTTEVEARPIVRVNIRRLRKKIEEDPDRPRYIQTVRDRGYRFVPA